MTVTFLIVAVFYVAVGSAAIALVTAAARIDGPDTDERDPHDEPADSGLAGEVEGWLRDLTPEPPPIIRPVATPPPPAVSDYAGPVRLGEPASGRPEGICRYRNP